MSCVLLHPQRIADIVETLRLAIEEGSTWCNTGYMNRLIQRLEIKGNSIHKFCRPVKQHWKINEKRVIAFGRLLWALNKKAYQQRYRGENLKGYIYPKNPKKKAPLSPVEFLKAWECMVYQMSEFTNHQPECKFVEDLGFLGVAVFNMMIHRTDEYENAGWFDSEKYER